MNFNDLVFETPEENLIGLTERYKAECRKAKQARFQIASDIYASVALGTIYYSNGIDTYEVAFVGKGKNTLPDEYTESSFPYLSAETAERLIQDVFRNRFVRKPHEEYTKVVRNG